MKNKSYVNVFIFVLIAGCFSFSAQNKTNTSKQIKQIGNAVPPNFSKFLLKTILKLN